MDRQLVHRLHWKNIVKQRIGALASCFGRRLTVSSIAFGPSNEDYSTLKAFADVSKKYGSTGFFATASLDASKLSKGFTSLSTSLTATKVELTSANSSTQRTVRDVKREPLDSMNDYKIDATWWHYKSRYVTRTTWTRNGWQKSTLQTASATGVALKKNIFGEGTFH